MTSSASIWPPVRIEPSSAAMRALTRPARMNAVMRAPNSRMMDGTTIAPTVLSGISG
jgi:hypothetical protein